MLKIEAGGGKFGSYDFCMIIFTKEMNGYRSLDARAGMELFSWRTNIQNTREGPRRQERALLHAEDLYSFILIGESCQPLLGDLPNFPYFTSRMRMLRSGNRTY